MISSIWAVLKDSISLMASTMGLIRDKNRAANAPAVVAAAIGKDDQKTRDSTAKAIEVGKLDDLRKLL